MSDCIKIHSHNISGDRRSEDIPTIPGLENLTFNIRVSRSIEYISSDVDVVAINEVRYEKNINFVVDRLTVKGFTCKKFFNNEGDMSFHNILGLRNNSQWEFDNKGSQHKWVGYEEGKAFLSDTHCTIGRDQHGRCVGIFNLRHKKDLKKKVCVAVSHVVPFGDDKKNQQNALFSLNRSNLARSIPTIIVGDLNRFPEDVDTFKGQLRTYDLSEATPSQLIIPHGPDASENIVITKPDNIGTFVPWLLDGVYEDKKSQPLSKSRLDLQVYTDKSSLITADEVVVRAAMYFPPNLNRPTKGYDPIRFMLDHRMASDHLTVVGTYQVKKLNR